MTKILIERSVLEQVMNWLSIINEPSAVKHVMRLEEILGAALEQPQVEQEPDWSNSKTLPSELWKSPLLSLQERLQIADGAVKWNREVADNLRSRLQQQSGHGPLVAELQDAFFEGFCAVETYNDIRLNSVEEEWKKYKTFNRLKE